MSEDPVFLNPEAQGKQIYKKFLSDPQTQNSYSYAKNNPITLSDPNGKFIDTILDIGFLAYDAGSYVYHSLTNQDTGADKRALTLDAAGFAIPGVTGLGVASRLNKVDNLADVTKGFEKLSDSAQVCRGGMCKADNFVNGRGVTLEGGKLKGVSVNAGNMPTSKLLENIPHANYGSTTVGEIRKLGGDVIRDVKNSYHATMQGITPKQAEKLFAPIKKNPVK